MLLDLLLLLLASCARGAFSPTHPSPSKRTRWLSRRPGKGLGGADFLRHRRATAAAVPARCAPVDFSLLGSAARNLVLQPRPRFACPCRVFLDSFTAPHPTRVPAWLVTGDHPATATWAGKAMPSGAQRRPTFEGYDVRDRSTRRNDD